MNRLKVNIINKKNANSRKKNKEEQRHYCLQLNCLTGNKIK